MKLITTLIKADEENLDIKKKKVKAEKKIDLR